MASIRLTVPPTFTALYVLDAAGLHGLAVDDQRDVHLPFAGFMARAEAVGAPPDLLDRIDWHDGLRPEVLDALPERRPLRLYVWDYSTATALEQADRRRFAYGPVRLWGSVAFIGSSWIFGVVVDRTGAPVGFLAGAGLLLVAAVGGI